MDTRSSRPTVLYARQMALGLVLFIAALQGASELFPVSSLGHAVVVPAIFHLGVDPAATSFVPFLTLLHLGTAAALLVIYRKDWAQLIAGFIRCSLRGRFENDTERLSMMVAVGTLPAALIGVALETPLKNEFAKPGRAAAFLIVNGAILFGAEFLRRRDERRHSTADRRAQEQKYATTSSLTFVKATAIGFAQALALIPGISRSGVTMAAGLGFGLRHDESLRFGFLLATPIIAGAGLLEVPQLFGSGIPLGRYALGAVVAGVIAYISARFLIRYFRVGRLEPFAIYCVALGIAGLIFTR